MSTVAPHYLATPFNSTIQNCFLEEPLTTVYKDQCYVVVDPSLITPAATQSLIRCCLGRLDTVEGCGYQCISNYTQDDVPNTNWWSSCVKEASLYDRVGSNTTNPPVCAVRPSGSGAGSLAVTGAQTLLSVMAILGIVLPVIMG
ncbi:hypothetical protein TWF696_000104 [Orbilia brochopaga]|uniref:Uncharacterized protein n=1 Tax=Orbilia brochopaga TaxID=3140254 RepID=A0AAV9VGQ3_9PEZI